MPIIMGFIIKGLKPDIMGKFMLPACCICEKSGGIMFAGSVLLGSATDVFSATSIVVTSLASGLGVVDDTASPDFCRFMAGAVRLLEGVAPSISLALRFLAEPLVDAGVPVPSLEPG